MTRISTLEALVAAACLAAPVAAQTDPAIVSWLTNRDGRVGTSPDATVRAIVNRIQADVQRVSYDGTDVYVEASGIPSYPIGPWGRNPNLPADQSYVFRIPRAPQVQNGPKTPVGLGSVGTLINGVAVFNAEDGRSYQNRGVWNQNAVLAEGRSFDTAGGHPAQRGNYHNHMLPSLLLAQRCGNSNHHSPLLGFAFDGFPIYGPYGFANTNGTGGVKRMRSSFRLRNLTSRQNGPPVSAQFPLGWYVEDFEYVANLGDLDEHNGRFAVTPDYPSGTYAYYTTIDANGTPEYPYILGPTYYGIYIRDNTRQRVTIPGNVTRYNGGLTMCSGAGCANPNPLQLHFEGLAAVGRSFGAVMTQGPANGAGFVALGFNASAPYPIDLTSAGMPGCSLYQSLDVIFALAFNGSGTASQPFTVPNQPSLSGARFWQQGFGFDSSANTAGIVATQSGKVVIGG